MEFQNEMCEFATKTTTQTSSETLDQQCPMKTDNTDNNLQHSDNNLQHSDNNLQHSDNNNDNITTTPAITKASTEHLERRKPVLRRVLRPILVLMRLFGLYFNDSSDLDKFGVRKGSRRLWKIYAVTVNLVIGLLFLKSLVGMWYVFHIFYQKIFPLLNKLSLF